MYERDRETCFAAGATFDFGWEDRWVWLGVVVTVWVGAVAEGAGDDGAYATFVCCNEEQKSSGIGYDNNASNSWNVVAGLFTYPPMDLELVCFVLLLHHEQHMVKQEHQ